MKIPEARFITLSPVRRATAFFAFFCLLFSLSSCQGEKEATHLQLLNEQTVIFTEMAGVLERLTKDGDVDSAVSELDTLIETLKLSKKKAAIIDPPTEEELKALADNEEHKKATKAFFGALTTYQTSDKASPKVQRTLANLHDSEPVKGEGSPK